jgi:glycosyltransferase involved in cell wall biosynthesis
MAAGKPYIAALNQESDAVAVTRDSGAGICVPAGDAHAFSRAVQTLYADQDGAQAMGRRGRAYAQAHFSKEVCLNRYEMLLSECACPGAPRPHQAASSPGVSIFDFAKTHLT